MMRFFARVCFALGLSALTQSTLNTWGAALPVTNYSFEQPSTEFVDLNVEGWQKIAKPDWFVETPGQTWDQLIGIFKDSPTDALVNIDQKQALYIFAVPQAGLSQFLINAEGQAATFQRGVGYQLKFSLVGGRGNMKQGVTLSAIIFYEASGNQVPIAQTSITNSATLFSDLNRLIDFEVNVPAGSATDPWIGKPIGILFISTTVPELAGGYWDLDNVRVSTIEPIEPAGLRLAYAKDGENFRVSWPSSNGKIYQLQVSNDLKTWSNRGEARPGTGETLSEVFSIGEAQRVFVRLQETGA